MNKDDVPAYARRPKPGANQEYEDLLHRLKKPIDPRAKATPTIRTPSPQALRFAPNGVPQLLKERGTRPVITQTTQPPSSGQTNPPKKNVFTENVWTIRLLALGFGFIVIVAQLIYWTRTKEQDQRHEETMAELRIRQTQVESGVKKGETSNPAPLQGQTTQRSSQGLAPGGTLYAADGDQFIIPENTKTIVREGATIVIVNTAWRIKSFSGDFTIERLGAEESASVPDQGYFERLPKWPTQTKVRIHVNSGVVQLNT
jgi:hypothetical protein